MRQKYTPPSEHLWGPQKCSKIDPCRIFRVPNGVLKMVPRPGLQKVRFCYYLLHFSQVPGLKKGPRFGVILGISFPKKTKKRGFQKSAKNHFQKSTRNGSQWGPHFDTKSVKKEKRRTHTQKRVCMLGPGGLDISNMRTIISVCVFRSSVFTDFVSKWGPHWDPFRMLFWS